MARQLGFVVYFLQGLGSLLSLVFLLGSTFLYKLSFMNALFFVLGPPAVISFIAALFVFSKISKKDSLCWDLIFRAKSFFVFAILAALVTLSDSLIVPRTLNTEEVIEYNLLCKLFGLASFAYSAFLQGLWPECCESLASREFTKVRSKIRSCCLFSILGVCLFTILIWTFSETVERRLLISFKTSCIFLFGLYLCIRVVSDFYAMALQSHSKLHSFFYIVPIQALLSVFFQYTLSKFLGVAGIILGLSLSYLLTVFWALPRELNLIVEKRLNG